MPCLLLSISRKMTLSQELCEEEHTLVYSGHTNILISHPKSEKAVYVYQSPKGVKGTLRSSPVNSYPACRILSPESAESLYNY